MEKVINLVSFNLWSYLHLQDIFSLLVKLLKTSLTNDMVSLCLSFLARVSIRREAVEQMRDGDFIAMLVDQIDSKDASINHKAKSLAYNLAFEPVIRQTMIECGFIAKVGAYKKSIRLRIGVPSSALACWNVESMICFCFRFFTCCQSMIATDLCLHTLAMFQLSWNCS